jgi:polar amino acid transport system substrate-binding protein
MKKTLFSAFFAALFFLTLTASPLLAQIFGKTFISGVDANYPPFTQINKHGQATGFDIEAIDWIAKRMGFTVKHQPAKWDKIIESLVEKKIDLVGTGLSINAERSALIYFTKPYWAVDQVVLVRKDSDLTVEQVLTGNYKIGVQKGNSEAKSMEASNGVNGRQYAISTYATPALAASDVVNGRIAAVVLNDAPAGEVIKHLAVKNIGSAGIPAEMIAYGVSKNNPDLLTALNDGLDLLMRDPFWQVLRNKYGIVDK